MDPRWMASQCSGFETLQICWDNQRDNRSAESNSTCVNWLFNWISQGAVSYSYACSSFWCLTHVVLCCDHVPLSYSAFNESYCLLWIIIEIVVRNVVHSLQMFPTSIWHEWLFFSQIRHIAEAILKKEKYW